MAGAAGLLLKNMNAPNNLLILIADPDEADRRRMAGVFAMNGYQVLQAGDCGSATRVLEEWPVDAVLLAHRLPPHDGFEVARHILARGMEVGTIMLVDSGATDLLLEAGKHEIGQVVQKPVGPDRLLNIVRRLLRMHGKNPDALASAAGRAFGPEELMRRALALAAQNARSKMGGPFGAVVADEMGCILGEGVNSVTARSDPTAHAEVLAIRSATGRRGSVRLDGCSIYCSSEPTMLGQALIIGTGIAQVYYGLSHAETGAVRVSEAGILGEMSKLPPHRSVRHTQFLHEEALAVFSDWQAQEKKIPD